MAGCVASTLAVRFHPPRTTGFVRWLVQRVNPHGLEFFPTVGGRSVSLLSVFVRLVFFKSEHSVRRFAHEVHEQRSRNAHATAQRHTDNLTATMDSPRNNDVVVVVLVAACYLQERARDYDSLAALVSSPPRVLS